MRCDRFAHRARPGIVAAGDEVCRLKHVPVVSALCFILLAAGAILSAGCSTTGEYGCFTTPVNRDLSISLPDDTPVYHMNKLPRNAGRNRIFIGRAIYVASYPVNLKYLYNLPHEIVEEAREIGGNVVAVMGSGSSSRVVREKASSFVERRVGNVSYLENRQVDLGSRTENSYRTDLEIYRDDALLPKNLRLTREEEAALRSSKRKIDDAVAQIYRKDGMFREDGTTGYRIYYKKNGKMHGTDTSYYNNGTIHMQTSYKNGRWHGRNIINDGDGRLDVLNTYCEGKQHGVSEDYDDGVLTYRGFWRFDRQQRKEMYENGKLASVHLFDRNGKIIRGEIYEDGRLAQIEKYRNGTRIGVVDVKGR
jgi:antitoxin component YwqK of YwqJK toxin-antitoxin module